MKTRRLVRTALVVAAASASLVAAGCGDKEKVTTEAATEGIWLDAGPLDYHIQGSRILEPGLEPDRAYLRGLPADVKPPGGRELWFGVFVRVENKTKHAALTSDDFEIRDTQGNTFRPITLDNSANPFAYKPITLQPNEVVPIPDSPQDFNSFSGALLLFKIPLSDYQNRPLTFHIRSSDGSAPPEASIDLDV